MKKSLMNCSKIAFVGVIFLIILSSITYAAGGFSISVSNNSLTVGETATLNISVSGAEGKFSISSSDSSVATVSSASEWIDGTKAITITSKKAGSATITVTATDVTESNLDANGNPVSVTGSKTVTITVKEPVQAPVEEPKPQTPTTTEPTTPTTTDTPTKSSNNYLKTLKCSAEGLTPAFSKNTTTYALNVGNDVENITIDAQPEDSKATVTVTGNTELVEGQNTIKVVVKAENGSTKTYTINAIKAAKHEILLSSLEIKGLDKDEKEIIVKLIPEFKPQTFNYGIETEEEIVKLKINAIASVDDAIVKIDGNENLKEGVNTVKILLNLPENKEEVVEYTLTVNRMKKSDIVTTTGIETEKENKTINIPKPVLIGAMIVSFIGIAVVLYIYNKPNNKKVKTEETLENNEVEEEQKGDIEEKEDIKEEIESKEEKIDKKSGRHF